MCSGCRSCACRTRPTPHSDRIAAMAGPDALALKLGMLAKSALLRQACLARSAILRHQPDRVLAIVGDCLVRLATIAYLKKQYAKKLGVLWIDAHPDVQT